MARKPKVQFPGVLYHVIVRGNKGQRVFWREADFNLYLSRNRIGASGRSIAGYLGRKLRGYPLSSMADYFQRDPVSLGQGIAEVEKRMREGDGFRGKLMRLE